MSPIFALVFCCVLAAINAKTLNHQDSKMKLEDPLIGIRAVSEIGCESDPGDCSVQECKELQARVNRLKGGRKCLDSDSILEIQTKIIEFANLRKARININQRCYKGGDAGHQQAVEDAGRAIENCGAKLNKL